MMLLRISLAFLIVFFNSNGAVFCQDILGCGGFVRSEVEINYSLVEVKLYTRQGSLKYQTDCAPHNGYYMVPVYDKGDYILKVEPPAGWTFNPESVELSIDGSTDKCSKGEDINFQFTGFGVVGKVVSKGHTNGPSGVTLALSKVGTKEPLKTAVSTEGGAFTFENVLPGEYTVTASHPTWQFEVASTSVRVDRETGNAGKELTVKGYDVTGQVFSEGEPIKGVNFILFSETVTKKEITGCDKADVKGFPRSLEMSPLCHVISQEDGRFIFPSLPYGDYKVVPFYKGENIFFDVVPAELQFSVQHGSVQLQEQFDVAGFSVQGKVLNAVGGTGIGDARIFLDGKEQAVTRSDGTYHLDSMKAGTYRLEAKVNQMTFEPVQVKVTPNTPNLPDMVASKFSLCGRIIIDKVPEGLGQVNRKRQVTMATKGAKSELTSLTSDTEGNFCTDVTPGTYILEVILSETEKNAGLKLAPPTKEVTITNSPVTGITFSQFRARVSGTVSCLETCGVIQLSLTSLSRPDERMSTQANEVSKGAAFHFGDVMPGKYRVSLHQEEWCWKEKSVEIEVTDRDVQDVNFQQSGYILSCSLSHEIKLNFEHAEKSGMVGEFDLPKGVNKFCLAEPGVYSLKPQSCHQFEKDTYRYDTSSPTVLTLTAVKHLAEGVIVTDERRTDIMVTIKSSMDDEQPTVLGPLVSDKEPIPAKDKKSKPVEQKGPFTYKFSHWARTGETLTISAASQELLFYPPSTSVTISGDTCPGEVVRLEGRQGVFIEGRIIPALLGVQIQVFAVNDPETVVVSMETNDKGQCRVGPLHGDVEYTAKAEKEGYVLTPVEGKLGHFKAFKLGQITVEVSDERGAALPGVLLSLSGETQYRSNKLTLDDGSMEFGSLSPGKYFLRPMMKEYTFEPSSQMVDVLEGSSIPIKVRGNRVAFSCYGSVTSLNGEPEAGIIIEAVGQGADKCTQLQEEGKSEPDGTFRIRGLQPLCEYEIRLKTGDVNQHIERSAPKSKIVKVTNEDLKGLRIIAFRRMTQMDLSGNVITDPDYLSSLKVTFYRDLSDDDSLDAPSSKLRELHTVSLGATTFFYLPPVTIDNKNYVIRLESSLSKLQYDYSPPEVAFRANSTYKHVTFHFHPKPKSVDQELKPSSFLIVPLTALVILLGYHYQKVLPMLSQGSSLLQGFMQKQPMSMSHNASAPIHINPELLDTGDNIITKKKKVRKV